MKWIMLVFGVLLFIAPFLSGFSGQPGLLWFSLIGGAAIAALGYFNRYRWATGVSLVIFLAPWVLGFAGTPAAAWSWVIGAATALLAGYKGFIANRKDQPGGAQLHHA